MKRGRVLIDGEVRSKYQIIDIHGTLDFTSLKEATQKAMSRSCNGKVVVRERRQGGWYHLGTFWNGRKTLYPSGF